MSDSPVTSDVQALSVEPSGGRLKWATPHTRWSLTPRMLTFGRRDRSDLPHLTVLWGTLSGEFDVHLKWEDGRPEPYQSLAKVPATTLTRAFQTWLAPEVERLRRWLLTTERRFRPGWLARQGYRVFWVPHEDVIARLQELAPKRRKKHQVNLDHLLGPQGLPRLVAENLYDPRILHHLPTLAAERGSKKAHVLQVTALGARRRGRLPTLYLLRGRRPGWRGWPWGALTRRVEATIEALLRRAEPVLTPLYTEVYEALRLDELNLTPPGEADWRRGTERFPDPFLSAEEAPAGG